MGIRERAAHAREVIKAADEIATSLRALLVAPETAENLVRAAYVDSREEKVLVQLDAVPVTALRDVSRKGLRIGALTEAGMTSVGQVVRGGQTVLEAISGIGPQTAMHLLEASEQVASAMREAVRFRIDMDPTDPVATRLLQALYTLGVAIEVAGQHRVGARDALAQYDLARPDAQTAAHGLRRFFAWGERGDRADVAVLSLEQLSGVVARDGLLEDAQAVARLLAEPMHPLEVWEDFRVRSTRYYSLLDAVVPSRLERVSSTGYLPSDMVQRVERQLLDTSLLTVSLRGYQAFGARFALAQRRIILGDEMGLGKTVQAIAVIAHRFTDGATHAVVTSPASVQTTWLREIRAHSTLEPHRIGGSYEQVVAQWERWRTAGGVALISIDSLADWRRHIESVDVFVVDEAHYAKNPEAHRSQAVAGLAAIADDVLMLTGTVMENRVEEFRTLVSYLRPDLAATLNPAIGVAGATAFRLAVAPVYLRRNAADVLEELPDLIQVEEWEEFGDVDGAAYRRAVEAGAFMAMRRAAYDVERPDDSAKVERLREIVEEALENGRKVLVFSYFLDVIDLVMRGLGDLAVGPLTGSLPPEKRQVIVDEFTTAERPRALVSQIQVGGVGLNLQAASVVVLCEPQLKPTAESQAIARAHRMGQVETVRVHRLLIDESVDEHLLRILDTKRRMFDAFARRSTLAEEVAAATDVSEAELARRIVDAEQTRLFIDPNVLSTEDAPI